MTLIEREIAELQEAIGQQRVYRRESKDGDVAVIDRDMSGMWIPGDMHVIPWTVDGSWSVMAEGRSSAAWMMYDGPTPDVEGMR